MKFATIKIGGVLFFAVSGLLGGYMSRGARADGIPSVDTLTYSGVLEDANGPVNAGTIPIQIALYDGDNMDAASVCTATSDMIDFTGKKGRFELALAGDCVTAVEQNPDVWVEVQVAGVPQLPRPKLGAVPFAIEAQRASGAAGALESQISMLQSDIAMLKDQVAALEAKKPVYTDGNKTYSLDAAFCDFSDPLTGKIGGYAVAKSVCETKCGSSEAHMCTVDELVRYLAAGGKIPMPPTTRAWIATGAYAQISNGGLAINDCNNFTSDQAGIYGTAWDGNSGGLACSTMANIACCK